MFKCIRSLPTGTREQNKLILEVEDLQNDVLFALWRGRYDSECDSGFQFEVTVTGSEFVLEVIKRAVCCRGLTNVVLAGCVSMD